MPENEIPRALHVDIYSCGVVRANHAAVRAKGIAFEKKVCDNTRDAGKPAKKNIIQGEKQ